MVPFLNETSYFKIARNLPPHSVLTLNLSVSVRAWHHLKVSAYVSIGQRRAAFVSVLIFYQVSAHVRGITAYVRGITANVRGITGYVRGITANVHGLTAYVRGITAYVHGITSYVCGLTVYVCGIRGT